VTDFRDQVPAYQTVRMTVPKTPVAALADTEAWQARGAYPQVHFAGGPAFGVAHEREDGGWELHPYFGAPAPQDARDGLRPYFARRGAEAEAAGDRRAARKWLAAAGRMDREAVDEIAVLGTRYRVVRADKFVRTGPLGPEMPRPTDPDPGEVGWACRVPDPAAGFVIDPVIATGLSEGILKLELLAAVRPRGTVPDEVREDSLRAARSHPGGVLLPAAFVAAELSRGHWRPLSIETEPTPQGARDWLVGHLRITVPWELNLGPAERAVYAEGADRLDDERADELTVAGRRFRIVRVERLIRIGPDGPEGPRPSDPDPQLPVLAQEQQLREQGLWNDEDKDKPVELSEDSKRFRQLFREEEERRKTRYGQP
jgi:hypothetical protein